MRTSSEQRLSGPTLRLSLRRHIAQQDHGLGNDPLTAVSQHATRFGFHGMKVHFHDSPAVSPGAPGSKSDVRKMEPQPSGVAEPTSAMGTIPAHAWSGPGSGQSQDWAKPRTCSIQGGLQPVLRYRMAHPSLDGGVLPEQVERHAPQQAQVARGVARRKGP